MVMGTHTRKEGEVFCFVRSLGKETENEQRQQKKVYYTAGNETMMLRVRQGRIGGKYPWDPLKVGAGWERSL